VVVLDVCRDNPFSWSRSGTRGLSIITRQPADSIIVYATSAGQKASDGEGRNGLFTSQLMPNLAEPDLEVKEVFNRTGADVSRASNRQQIPAIYNQFFGTAYLATGPSGEAQTTAYRPAAPRPSPQPRPTPKPAPTEEKRENNREAQLWSVGASLGSSFSAPRFIGTARGTIAPFSNSFMELGFDFGLVSGVPEIGYYSLCPFAHVSYFMPVNNLGGWYAGAGGGYLLSRLSFPEGDVEVNIFAFDFVAGFNLFDFLDISYTLRTNFEAASHKVSVGYIYRFK